MASVIQKRMLKGMSFTSLSSPKRSSLKQLGVISEARSMSSLNLQRQAEAAASKEDQTLREISIFDTDNQLT